MADFTPGEYKALERFVGRGVHRGILSFFCNLCLWILVIVFIDYLLFNWFDWRKDSTDGEYRSGMEIRIDYLTGCEYLATGGGGLTPRLRDDGSQICAGFQKKESYK